MDDTFSLAQLPKHKFGMSIRHNDHKSYHSTVKGELDDDDSDLWLNAEDRQLAIDTDELWTIQWYPDSSVGFCMVRGSTLANALACLGDEDK